MNAAPGPGSKSVFVVGAHIPSGGTYMAYRLGRLISEKWDCELVPVEIDSKKETHDVWSYEHHYRKLTMQELMREAGRNDVLVCNPSYSRYLPGLSFSGRKLMYIQGINTCKVIDGFFDKYVAASPFVREFILQVYGMTVPVIAPFIHHDHLPGPLPAWKDRPERSVVVGLKEHGEQFLAHFKTMTKARYPELEFSMTTIPRNTPHRQFLRIISENRYFLWLSPVEGFGLPPLEAMMCGASVVGFRGGGGSYFRDEENALICDYPDFQRLIALFARLLMDDSLALELSRNGKRTASHYTFERFKDSWIRELAPLLS